MQSINEMERDQDCETTTSDGQYSPETIAASLQKTLRRRLV